MNNSINFNISNPNIAFTSGKVKYKNVKLTPCTNNIHNKDYYKPVNKKLNFISRFFDRFKKLDTDSERVKTELESLNSIMEYFEKNNIY